MSSTLSSGSVPSAEAGIVVRLRLYRVSCRLVLPVLKEARTAERRTFAPAECGTVTFRAQLCIQLAPEYNPLFDPELPPDEQPNLVGRARFGSIAIANSDSGRAAYTDSAVDQADRAVNELLRA